MANVKFYLDKAGKNALSPIHLVLVIKGEKIKVATGEKIANKYWDKSSNSVKASYLNHRSINTYLVRLKDETEKLLSSKPPFTAKKLKEKISSLVDSYRKFSGVNLACE